MSSAVLETGQVVARGEWAEVPDEVAERYSGQEENFEIEPGAEPEAEEEEG